MPGSSGNYSYRWSSSPAVDSRLVEEATAVENTTMSNRSEQVPGQTPSRPPLLSSDAIQRQITISTDFHTVTNQTDPHPNILSNTGRLQFPLGTEVFSPASVSFESPPIVAEEEDTAEVPYTRPRRDGDIFLNENMLYREDNRRQIQGQITTNQNNRGITIERLPTLLVQEQFREQNDTQNFTHADDLTITCQNNMKPDVSVSHKDHSQGSQLSRNNFQMANNRPPIRAVPAEQGTNIEQVQAAGVNRRVDYSSLFCRETNLSNVPFSNNQQNSFQSSLNFNRQAELNLFDPFGTNYNRISGARFHINETNLFERSTTQHHSESHQPFLRHDQLHSNFLNRELFDLETELLGSNKKHPISTEFSADYTEGLERELEESKRYNQSNLEDSSRNQNSFTYSDVYIDASNQTSDEQIEENNPAIKFQPKFHEKSFEPCKTIGNKDVWEGLRGEQMRQKKRKLCNRNDRNACEITACKDWVYCPKDVITPEQIRLASGVNMRNDLLEVDTNDIHNNEMDQEVGKSSRAEALFYESRIKEIDAIDSALSYVEHDMKRASRGYDLYCANGKNIESFRNIEYSKKGIESFIPRAIELTVMPLTIQPRDAKLPAETEKSEETSESRNPSDEFDISNISGSSTGLEMETSTQNETGSVLPANESVETMPSSTEPLTLTPIQQAPSSTNEYCMQVDHIANVDQNKPNIGDESTTHNSTKEKKYQQSHDTTENITETTEITSSQPAFRPEHQLPLEAEVQEYIAMQYPAEKVSESDDLESLTILEMNTLITISKTNIDQPSMESDSPEISSIEPSLIQIQQAPYITSAYNPQPDTGSDIIPEEGLESSNLDSAGPSNLGERRSVTPDNETNQAFARNDPNTVKKPSAINAEENQCHQSKADRNSKIDTAFCLEENNKNGDFNVSGLSARINTTVTNVEHSEGEVEKRIPESTEIPVSSSPATLSEHKSLLESEIQENLELSLKPNPTESSTTLDLNPSGEIGFQRKTKIDQSPNQEPSSQVEAKQQTLIAQTYSHQSDVILEKRSEEHEGVNLDLGGLHDLSEMQSVTSDSEANIVVPKHDLSILDEHAATVKVEERQYHDSQIKGNKKTDLILSLEEGNLNRSSRTKIEISTEERTENIPVQNPASELSKQNTKMTSSILEINPLRQTSSKSETLIDIPLKEAVSTEVSLAEQPSLTEINQAPCSASATGPKCDNMLEKRSEHGGTSSGGPDYLSEMQRVITPDKIDPIIVDNPITTIKPEEKLCHESKLKINEKINVPLRLKETNKQSDSSDLSSRTITEFIENIIQHGKEETEKIPETVKTATQPSVTIPEHQLPSEPSCSEIQNPSQGLSKPNISKASTEEELGLSDETMNVQSPKEGASSPGNPIIERFPLPEVKDVPLPDELSIQENIEIHMSPNDLAWLSASDSQTDIVPQPCDEPLENYQIEQEVPLLIEKMLQIDMPNTPPNEEPMEESSSQIYTEPLTVPNLPEVPASAIVEQNLNIYSPSLLETGHTSTEVAQPSTTLTDPIAPRASANEPLVAEIEAEPSSSCVETSPVPPLEPVPSCSSPSRSLKRKCQSIGVQTEDDDELYVLKRRKSSSKPPMKPPEKETRKSTRLKKSPDRLFYIGKGQLF